MLSFRFLVGRVVGRFIGRIFFRSPTARTHARTQDQDRATEDRARASHPVASGTVEALDAHDMQRVVIMTTAYGKSFTVGGFSGWMRDAMWLALGECYQPTLQEPFVPWNAP